MAASYGDGMAEELIKVTFRIPRELNDRLQRTADDLVFGRNLLVQWALEKYLDAADEAAKSRSQD